MRKFSRSGWKPIAPKLAMWVTMPLSICWLHHLKALKNSNVRYGCLLCKCVPGALIGGLADDAVDCVAVSSEVALDCLLEEPVEVEVTYAVNLRFHSDLN